MKKSLLVAVIISVAVLISCQKSYGAQAKSANDVNVAAASSQAEQAKCPVMGGKINKKYSTQYKGKTVYFCCSGCKPEFDKNPEKYVGKLPQFGGKKS